jgi:hypothetical protein
MERVFVVSTTLILLLSSGIFAIDQIQGFDIYSSNVGTVTGTGTSAATSVNFIPVTNAQEAIDGSGQIKVVQTGIGAVIQGGSAVGTCGVYGYDQGVNFVGDQWQTFSDLLSLGLNSQNLSADVEQNVLSAGSLGSAVALQNLMGGQNQLIITPYGVSVDIQCLGIGLVDGIGGHSSSLISRGLSIQRSSLK